jgi:probable F420-dependent oxidoreductase
MQIGVMFPQNEIGSDVDDIHAFVRAAEAAGCRHVWATDHVVGVDRNVYTTWDRPYSREHEFHEPLMLFAHLAAISDLEFVTGIVILPQRQTVLVAKQAAELDILCRGRLRLGVGIGWNRVEYESLGAGFAQRGRRIEEQIELLRRLWTEPSVDFRGEFDVVPNAGIAPLPVQRPIPVWMGAGASDAALSRVGRLADGYLANATPTDGSDVARRLAVVRAAAEQAGRDPASIGVEGLLPVVDQSDDRVQEIAGRWRALGATHLSIDPRAVSLHVNQDVSMEHKVREQRSSTSRLIEAVQRGSELIARA